MKSFKYVSPIFANYNSIHNEIKCRLKVGNIYYFPVKTHLPSWFLSKDLKIKIYKTTILPVRLYEFETYSLTLKDESRLTVFENWILKRILGPSGDENENFSRLEIVRECNISVAVIIIWINVLIGKAFRLSSLIIGN